MIDTETLRIDAETLLELTESYLKSLIAEASQISSSDFDSYAAFGELGVDSFHVLEIVKKLEEDFGTLPKTLLFENFNINDLAHYFVNEHAKVLATKFSEEAQVGSADASKSKSASSCSSAISTSRWAT